MKGTRLIPVAVLIIGTGVPLHVARAQQPGIKRTDLQRHDLGVPGREVVQVRVDFAPGVGFPKHSHPGEEIVYVIEGVLEYEVEGKAPVTLKAGEVLFIRRERSTRRRTSVAATGRSSPRMSWRKGSRSSCWSSDAECTARNRPRAFHRGRER